MLLTYMVNHGPASRAQLSDFVDKSAGTVISRLNHLIEIGLVRANGNKFDPNRTYEAVLK